MCLGEGVVRFFKRAANRFIRDGVNDLQYDQLIGEELHGPVSGSRWCC